MVRTFIASLALVSFAVPAFAKPQSSVEAPATETFTRDGVTYVYTTTPKQAGHRLIEGTADGVPFRLMVDERKVDGTVGLNPVQFKLSEVRTRPERERLAAR